MQQHDQRETSGMTRGLAFVAISVGTTVVLLLGSAVALLILWLRLRAGRGQRPPQVAA
jgi:hypothetical protein